jgi:CheY-like chemotaxis protein
VLHCSPDPLEGFELAKKMVPDLMILDINLPHIDGFELFSMIKSQPTLVHIPVMALSANAMPADIAKGLSLGFDHYLTKPVDIPQLLTLLNTYHAQLSKGK